MSRVGAYRFKKLMISKASSRYWAAGGSKL
jgi:hypothetical protein